MTTKAFAIYDSKAQVFGVPFFMPQAGVALRMFMDLANDPQTSVSKHPEDYMLYQVGSYDDATAEFQNTIPPVLLGIAADFKKLTVSETLEKTRLEEIKAISTEEEKK